MVRGALCESAAAEDDYGKTVLAVAHYSEPLARDCGEVTAYWLDP